GDASRSGVRIGQGEGTDVLLRVDVEATEDTVAELAVPQLVVPAAHAEAVKRGSAAALRMHRCIPDARLAGIRIEVAYGVAPDVRVPDASGGIAAQLVFPAEAEIVDAGYAAIGCAQRPDAPGAAVRLQPGHDTVEERCYPQRTICAPVQG